MCDSVSLILELVQNQLHIEQRVWAPWFNPQWFMLFTGKQLHVHK